MTLTSTLSETPTKELLRAFNSQKAYLFFDISVFNVGASISIVCTDTYKEINQNTWNGYDFIIENDDTTKDYIMNTLKERLNARSSSLPKISPIQRKRIKKLINTHCVVWW